MTEIEPDTVEQMASEIAGLISDDEQMRYDLTAAFIEFSLAIERKLKSRSTETVDDLDGTDAELCERLADQLDAKPDNDGKADRLIAHALRMLAKGIWDDIDETEHQADPQYILTQTGDTVSLVITYCDQYTAAKDMRGWRYALNTGSLKQLIDKEVWHGYPASAAEARDTSSHR